MKRFSTLVVVMFLYTAANCQYFFGYDYTLYKNTTLKVMPLDRRVKSCGYRHFLKRPKHSATMYGNILYRGRDCADMGTIADSLENRKFVVTDIIEKDRDYFLELKGEDNNTIYYDYNPDEKNNFPFTMVSDIAMLHGSLCGQIQSDNTTSYPSYSTLARGEMEIHKYSGDAYSIYFSAKIIAEYDASEGITLILDDDTKIAKPDAKVSSLLGDFDDNAREWVHYYSATINLTSAEVAMCRTKEIKGYYIGTHYVEIGFPKKYLVFFQCLQNMN